MRKALNNPTSTDIHNDELISSFHDDNIYTISMDSNKVVLLSEFMDKIKIEEDNSLPAQQPQPPHSVISVPDDHCIIEVGDDSKITKTININELERASLRKIDEYERVVKLAFDKIHFYEEIINESANIISEFKQRENKLIIQIKRRNNGLKLCKLELDQKEKEICTMKKEFINIVKENKILNDKVVELNNKLLLFTQELNNQKNEIYYVNEKMKILNDEYNKIMNKNVNLNAELNNKMKIINNNKLKYNKIIELSNKLLASESYGIELLSNSLSHEKNKNKVVSIGGGILLEPAPDNNEETIKEKENGGANSVPYEIGANGASYNNEEIINGSIIRNIVPALLDEKEGDKIISVQRKEAVASQCVVVGIIGVNINAPYKIDMIYNEDLNREKEVKECNIDNNIKIIGEENSDESSKGIELCEISPAEINSVLAPDIVVSEESLMMNKLKVVSEESLKMNVLKKELKNELKIYDDLNQIKECEYVEIRCIVSENEIKNTLDMIYAHGELGSSRNAPNVLLNASFNYSSADKLLLSYAHNICINNIIILNTYFKIIYNVQIFQILLFKKWNKNESKPLNTSSSGNILLSKISSNNSGINSRNNCKSIIGCFFRVLQNVGMIFIRIYVLNLCVNTIINALMTQCILDTLFKFNEFASPTSQQLQQPQPTIVKSVENLNLQPQLLHLSTHLLSKQQFQLQQTQQQTMDLVASMQDLICKLDEPPITIVPSSQPDPINYIENSKNVKNVNNNNINNNITIVSNTTKLSSMINPPPINSPSPNTPQLYPNTTKLPSRITSSNNKMTKIDKTTPKTLQPPLTVQLRSTSQIVNEKNEHVLNTVSSQNKQVQNSYTVSSHNKQVRIQNSNKPPRTFVSLNQALTNDKAIPNAPTHLHKKLTKLKLNPSFDEVLNKAFLPVNECKNEDEDTLNDTNNNNKKRDTSHGSNAVTLESNNNDDIVADNIDNSSGVLFGIINNDDTSTNSANPWSSVPNDPNDNQTNDAANDTNINNFGWTFPSSNNSNNTNKLQVIENVIQLLKLLHINQYVLIAEHLFEWYNKQKPIMQQDIHDIMDDTIKLIANASMTKFKIYEINSLNIELCYIDIKIIRFERNCLEIDEYVIAIVIDNINNTNYLSSLNATSLNKDKDYDYSNKANDLSCGTINIEICGTLAVINGSDTLAVANDLNDSNGNASLNGSNGLENGLSSGKIVLSSKDGISNGIDEYSLVCKITQNLFNNYISSKKFINVLIINNTKNERNKSYDNHLELESCIKTIKNYNNHPIGKVDVLINIDFVDNNLLNSNNKNDNEYVINIISSKDTTIGTNEYVIYNNDINIKCNILKLKQYKSIQFDELNTKHKLINVKINKLDNEILHLGYYLENYYLEIIVELVMQRALFTLCCQVDNNESSAAVESSFDPIDFVLSALKQAVNLTGVDMNKLGQPLNIDFICSNENLQDYARIENLTHLNLSTLLIERLEIRLKNASIFYNNNISLRWTRECNLKLRTHSKAISITGACALIIMYKELKFPDDIEIINPIELNIVNLLYKRRIHYLASNVSKTTEPMDRIDMDYELNELNMIELNVQNALMDNNINYIMDNNMNFNPSLQIDNINNINISPIDKFENEFNIKDINVIETLVYDLSNKIQILKYHQNIELNMHTNQISLVCITDWYWYLYSILSTLIIILITLIISLLFDDSKCEIQDINCIDISYVLLVLWPGQGTEVPSSNTQHENTQQANEMIIHYNLQSNKSSSIGEVGTILLYILASFYGLLSNDINHYEHLLNESTLLVVLNEGISLGGSKITPGGSVYDDRNGTFRKLYTFSKYTLFELKRLKEILSLISVNKEHIVSFMQIIDYALLSLKFDANNVYYCDATINTSNKYSLKNEIENNNEQIKHQLDIYMYECSNHLSMFEVENVRAVTAVIVIMNESHLALNTATCSVMHIVYKHFNDYSIYSNEPTFSQAEKLILNKINSLNIFSNIKNIKNNLKYVYDFYD